MIRGAWTAFALIAAAIIAWRFEPVVDLAWFLPAAETNQEQVLLERLGQGQGSQLIFVSLEIEPDADAYAVSNQVRDQLESSGLFRRVTNGAPEMNVSSVPPVIWNNRYLLADVELDEAALRVALTDRLADLALVADADIIKFFAADPVLATVDVFESIAPARGANLEWLASDGSSAILIVETHAAAFELAEQEVAVNFINSLSLPAIAGISLHGMGVYSVELQNSIKREVRIRSVAATIAVAIIFLVAYRRPIALLAGGLPLFLGALGGLASIALVFGKVHGITLAFGFTLLGVAIDYPLHVLSHVRGKAQDIEVGSLWGTIRVGVFSTVAAFLAIAAGGSTGLAQLGMFSAVGILVTYLATRTLLPQLLNISPTVIATKVEIIPRVSQSVWVIVLLLCGAAVFSNSAPQWSNDLSSASPVPLARLLEDQKIRQRFGVPDIRTLVVVRGSDQQTVLRDTEQLTEVLKEMQSEDYLAGYQSVVSLVPSVASQERRRSHIIAAGDISERLSAVASAVGFRGAAFAAFSARLLQTGQGEVLVTPADYAATELESVVNSSLYFEGDQWVSLVTLFGLNDPAATAAMLAMRFPQASFVDLKNASNSLMQRYRVRVVEMLLIALLIITVYLLMAVGVNARTLWVLGTLIASQSFTIIVTAFIAGQLTLFNLIAVVLTAGLVLDYALFFSRPEATRSAGANTFHAVSICAISTFAAFAILSTSAIPVLQSIGTTVAIGIGSGYLLAVVGSSQARQSSGN